MNDQVHSHQHRLPPSGRGRAQDRSRDDLIVGATLELLAGKGYHGLTMTDIASRAGVSKATLYRRWTAKADLVADAVATLSPLNAPRYPGTSLRENLLALMEQAGTCKERPEVVTATIEMARLHPDLYRTLNERFGMFIRAELNGLARHAAEAGFPPLSEIELDVIVDMAVALISHHAGLPGASVPRDRLVRLVDYGLMVLLTGKRTAK